MSNLIEKIKQYEEMHGLTDEKFSKLIGMNKSTWSYIKRGKRKPGSKFLMRVSSRIPQLSLSVYDFIMGNGEGKK